MISIRYGATRSNNLDDAHPIVFGLLRILRSLNDLELPESGGQYKENQKNRIAEQVHPLLNQLFLGFLLQCHDLALYAAAFRLPATGLMQFMRLNAFVRFQAREENNRNARRYKRLEDGGSQENSACSPLHYPEQGEHAERTYTGGSCNN